MDVVKFSDFQSTNESIKDKLKGAYAKFKEELKAIKKDFNFDEDDFNFKDLSSWLDGKKSIKQILKEKEGKPEAKLN